MNLSEIKRPLVIAHRGYRSRYPENTIAAFSAAVDAGAPMIELDVTLTRDRRLIVIHDDTLDRTTDGTGLVSQHNLSELRRFDAGSWFDACFEGEPLPTLEEVLDAVGNRVLINIEIKSSAYEKEHRADAIENQVVDVVYTMHLENSILVSSFNGHIIENVRALDARLPISIISREIPAAHTIAQWKEMDLFSWHPQYQIITNQDLASMHDADISVFPYTVNAVEDADQMLAMGADGMFTDNPVLMLSHLGDTGNRKDQ